MAEYCLSDQLMGEITMCIVNASPGVFKPGNVRDAWKLIHIVWKCSTSELILLNVGIYFAFFGATTPGRKREKTRQESDRIDTLAAGTPLRIEELADPLTDDGMNASFGKRIKCTVTDSYEVGQGSTDTPCVQRSKTPERCDKISVSAKNQRSVSEPVVFPPNHHCEKTKTTQHIIVEQTVESEQNHTILPIAEGMYHRVHCLLDLTGLPQHRRRAGQTSGN